MTALSALALAAAEDGAEAAAAWPYVAIFLPEAAKNEVRNNVLGEKLAQPNDLVNHSEYLTPTNPLFGM